MSTKTSAHPLAGPAPIPSGAYTVAGACDFNGIEFTTPNKFYVFSDSAVDMPVEEEQAVAVEAVMA